MKIKYVIDKPQHSLSRILDSFGADAAFASTAVSVRAHMHTYNPLTPSPPPPS
jgi:hypothetical protein